ncbi:hypothetical protein MVEN_00909400 [Mycena venus]|uniref:Protein kinase domain-containing protein n=1 Tax=Mycena venus TaxID=2733690 RepID=A0A8H7D1D0_9AGAR|nr:hypothetical protein MVEN_00909400 [Mycena venus]
MTRPVRHYTLFIDLHNAPQCFSALKNVPRTRINHALVKDNLKIAQALQLLFHIRSYKVDFPTLPRDHALAVINLTHYILDVGLAENDAIPDYDIFSRRAHTLLNRLAKYLDVLPDEIAINGVMLLGDHAVKHGGFSNIYHGIYVNAAGERVEVALKVLKIFRDQSDADRRSLQAKFSKEALLWLYLKHKNIVPFFGVDFTTFPSPARAMFLPWMPLGSVLKYMGENSPSSLYALELLCGVIDGLNYLHSKNVVHGDLCARNILMDKERRACLTDFGLAAFIESDTSMQSTTKGGSTRWMAPELLRPVHGAHSKRTPATDVWAFGCVCCEIWSEGTVPFSHIGADEGVPFAFIAGDLAPYPSIPHDNDGNPMPDQLWEIVQWCWKPEPRERPNAQAIANVLIDMAPHIENPARTVTIFAGELFANGGTSGKSVACPSDEAASIAARTPRDGKGKTRAYFQEYSTVRFGPVDMNGSDPREVFETVLDGLLNFVARELLVEPVAVESLDLNHVGLRFRTPVEANNFSMTWMVYRFEPFEQVEAELMD